MTEGHQPLDSILLNLHLSLKIASCREYLEFKAEFSGSMRNSNLIYSDLSASGPSTLSIFFILETKEWGFSSTEGGKAAVDLENLVISIVWIKIFNRSVITALYDERTIAFYDLF
jgi:hypothetical protein